MPDREARLVVHPGWPHPVVSQFLFAVGVLQFVGVFVFLHPGAMAVFGYGGGAVLLVLMGLAVWHDRVVIDPRARTVTWRRGSRRRTDPFDAFAVVEVHEAIRFRGDVRIGKMRGLAERVGVRLVGPECSVLLMHAREDGLAARQRASRVASAMHLEVRDVLHP
ncbi:MAG: hypothetical protein AAF211_04595 [Myxococcota bacterium]